MGKAALIEQLILERLEGSDCFIVDIKTNASESSIQVYIDSDTGLEISFCARLSRQVSAALDELEDEGEAYRFEISSPGADKPLVNIRQYPKHIGRELALLFKDGTEKTGILKSVEGEVLELEEIVDKKKKTIRKTTINFSDIEHSTVVISFKKQKK